MDVKPSLYEGTIREKGKFYNKYAFYFDLVFIGDSRTYCGIHCDLMDKLLGKRCANMAAVAHWFPTQLPFCEDLVRTVPPGTVVVFTIGHQNFKHIRVQNSCPIGLKRALKYIEWGYSPDSIIDNLIYYNPVTQLIAKKSDFRDGLNRFMDNTVCELGIRKLVAKKPQERPEPSGQGLKAREFELESSFRSDPDVHFVRFPEEEGGLHSAELIRTGNSSSRVELDPSYFRHKQRERHAQLLSERPYDPNYEFVPDRQYWETFKGIIKLFKDRGISLIVNEIEEAPHNYRDDVEKESKRSFMREVVKPYVESQGFPYVRADFSKLSDEDYFDYNHLNSKGGEKYDKLLAEELRPYLKMEGAKK